MEKKERKKKRSMRSIPDTVGFVELCSEPFFHSASADVALGGGPRERGLFDDKDECVRGDLLVEVPASVEVTDPPEDVLLERLVAHAGLGLDEQRRGGPSVADDDALRDEVGARRAHVVLDRLGVAPQRVLRLYPVVVAATEDVRPRADLHEQIAGVIVAVDRAERGVGAVSGLGQNDELKELCVDVDVGVGLLVGGVRVEREEPVRGALDRLQVPCVGTGAADRQHHRATLRVAEEVLQFEAVLVRVRFVLRREHQPRVKDLVQPLEKSQQLCVVP